MTQAWQRPALVTVGEDEQLMLILCFRLHTDTSCSFWTRPPNGVQQREAPGPTGRITQKWEPEPSPSVCRDRRLVASTVTSRCCLQIVRGWDLSRTGLTGMSLTSGSVALETSDCPIRKQQPVPGRGRIRPGCRSSAAMLDVPDQTSALGPEPTEPSRAWERAPALGG